MMPYPALQLVSDGIKRLAVYRDPLTKPADAVIWLHGGNGDAVEFLNGIRPRVDVMDIAPQGLVTGSNPGWTNPWESDIPEEAIDNLIDVRFMASLEAQVRIHSLCQTCLAVRIFRRRRPGLVGLGDAAGNSANIQWFVRSWQKAAPYPGECLEMERGGGTGYSLCHDKWRQRLTG